MKRLYKLQKGPTCTIRTDEAGVKDALANGYVYLGECDEAYNIISTASPVFGRADDAPKGEAPKDDDFEAAVRPVKKPKAEKPED
jgi:hypothetical protein